MLSYRWCQFVKKKKWTVGPSIKWITCVYLQTLVNALLSIVLCGPGGPVFPDSLTLQGSHRSEQICHTTPPSFCSAVIKLVAMQMQALGVCYNQYAVKPVVRDHLWDKEKSGLTLQGDYCIWIIDDWYMERKHFGRLFSLITMKISFW